MEIEFYKSKGFTVYLLPTITFADYGTFKNIDCAFWWWHFRITWRKRV